MKILKQYTKTWNNAEKIEFTFNADGEHVKGFYNTNHRVDFVSAYIEAKNINDEMIITWFSQFNNDPKNNMVFDEFINLCRELKIKKIISNIPNTPYSPEGQNELYEFLKMKSFIINEWEGIISGELICE